MEMTQTHDANKYVGLFGGLYIEMALWEIMDDLLESSGLITACNEGGVTSAETVDLFREFSHLTITQLGCLYTFML